MDEERPEDGQGLARSHLILAFHAEAATDHVPFRQSINTEKKVSSFDGRLKVSGETGLPLGVEIDLTGERMVVRAGDSEVADWDVEELRINAEPDGFHILAEGEEVVINVADEGRFAVELGLRSAYPGLRAKMAAVLRQSE